MPNWNAAKFLHSKIAKLRCNENIIFYSNWRIAVLRLLESFTSNLEELSNLLSTQANSASYSYPSAQRKISSKGKGKGNCIAVMEQHVTAMECHLPYGITQCYLLPDTSERTPPSPQPVRPVVVLLTWGEGTVWLIGEVVRQRVAVWINYCSLAWTLFIEQWTSTQCAVVS